jgi:hypothetical protein
MIRQKLTDFAKDQPYLNPTQIDRFISRPNGALPWYLFNFVLWHESWIEQKAHTAA